MCRACAVLFPRMCNACGDACSAVSADNAGVTKELETLFQECVAADSSIVSKVTKLDMRRFLRYAAKVRRLLPHVVVSRVP